MHSRTLEPEIQYATLEQQGETAQLGMWVFIATETLFFGALIFTYYIYRNAYPKEFAEAGVHVLWAAPAVELLPHACRTWVSVDGTGSSVGFTRSAVRVTPGTPCLGASLTRRPALGSIVGTRFIASCDLGPERRAEVGRLIEDTGVNK